MIEDLLISLQTLKDVAEKLQKNLDMQDMEIDSLRKVQHENEVWTCLKIRID